MVIVVGLPYLKRVSNPVYDMLNWGYGPDEETVEVGVRPLLALPPVVELSCLDVLAHGIRWGRLGNNSQEQGAPIDSALMRLQMRWELKLKQTLSAGQRSHGRPHGPNSRR